MLMNEHGYRMTDLIYVEVEKYVLHPHDQHPFHDYRHLGLAVTHKPSRVRLHCALCVQCFLLVSIRVNDLKGFVSNLR
jgi:hypothetical protein